MRDLLRVESDLPILLILAVGLLAAPTVRAQYSSGSDGSDGALDVTVNTTLAMPADGVFHYTTVTVRNGATLDFEPNALNTPVYLLATGDVVVEGGGTVDLSGEAGDSLGEGRGGPGGFRGGVPGYGAGSPGAGHGPGGGLPNDGTGTGEGGFGQSGGGPTDGATYGTPLLLGLVGGSGGAGQTTYGGGGGGGAILIASDTSITVHGVIRSDGGGTSGGGYGSGGAIRLVAPTVAGGGQLDVSPSGGRDGRIRVDAVDRSGMAFTRFGPFSAGQVMIARTTALGRLDIIEAAGTAIAEGESSAVLVQLDGGADPNQNIVVQGRDFTGMVDIEVVLIPDSGTRVVYPAQIDMGTGNPATVTVPVTFPVNTATRVSAWRR